MTKGEVKQLLVRAAAAMQSAQRAHETTMAISIELAAALRATVQLVDELAVELHRARQDNQASISRIVPREPR